MPIISQTVQKKLIFTSQYERDYVCHGAALKRNWE